MKHISFADFEQLPNSYMINQPSTEILNKRLRGISIDSRSIKADQVFWALKGPKFDGHDFVVDAMNHGAAAAVINKTHVGHLSGRGFPLIIVKDSLHALQKMATLHRKKFKIPVLAITGTNGKTTTKEMIAWILQTKMNVHRTEGNLNNHIGVPLTLLNMNDTHDISIVELGTNHPGEIELLSTITKPTAALITNIGRGHLEFFSSLEGVAREKLELFNQLGRDGTIFINCDDRRLANYPGEGKNIWSYSMNEKVIASVTGRLVELNANGEGMWILNNRTKIVMNIAGLHNVRNALAASTVAISYKYSEQEIKAALEDFTPYEKRMQIIKNDNITIINDSYNANPDSYIPALETLKHVALRHNSRKVVVMGDMLELGLESDALHQDLFFDLLDYDLDGIFTLGDACSIAADKLKDRGFKNIYSYDSHRALAENLKKFIKSKDIILLKGSRGMQMEKVLAFL
jgi:UDP-N-acetylmuramoyl-tripeptide--D-alanyl-D-alanine ligase